MIALLYDIHGNDRALEAVIADARAAGADAWVLGGDHCLIGAQPVAVLERLAGLPADTIWLRGNVERWTARPESADIPLEAIRDAARWTAGAIGRERVDELAALPHVLADIPFAGAERTVFCHASPGSDMIGFSDQAAAGDGEAAANEYEANTIVCGHTHLQFAREIGVLEVVNPGSVGLPFDGDRRAAYGLLLPDGSFDLRRVEYDVEAALAAYDQIDEPWTELAAHRLAGARP